MDLFQRLSDSNAHHVEQYPGLEQQPTSGFDEWGSWDRGVLGGELNFVPELDSSDMSAFAHPGVEQPGIPLDVRPSGFPNQLDTPELSPGYDASYSSEDLYLPIDFGNFEHGLDSVMPLNELVETSEKLTQQKPTSQPQTDAYVSEARKWFLNQRPSVEPRQRSFPRRRSIYRGHMSPRIQMPIPSPTTDSQTALDPMQRWQNSPPESEAISMSALAKAIADEEMALHSNRPSLSRAGSGSRARGHRRNTSSANSNRAHSVSSIGSVASSRSNQSKDSVTSAISSNNGHKQSHRVSKARQKGQPANPNSRIFQCTFCCDTFKSKYDWTRHEKSLHLVLEKWVCTPQGGVIVDQMTNESVCAYCDAADPTPEHLELHGHHSCSRKPVGLREFRRKDHLKQHMRLVHGIDNFPKIDQWKSDRSNIRSRCGFCNETMQTWSERAQHLSDHFRQGKKMEEWQGPHGFDADVQAEVTNAVPPYLIGFEARSIIPYSATDPHSLDQFSQISFNTRRPVAKLETPDVSIPSAEFIESEDHSLLEGAAYNGFAEFLTRQLARYAREQMKAGILPTDAMFQQESRRILFGNDDPWNQTIADFKEWLDDFRRQQCLEEPSP